MDLAGMALIAAALVPTFATGLTFSWSADLIAITALVERQLLPRVPRMAAVCFAILGDSVLQSVPEGLPSMAHECIYSVIVGTGVYGMVWILGNTIARRSFLRLGRLRSDASRLSGNGWPS